MTNTCSNTSCRIGGGYGGFPCGHLGAELVSGSWQSHSVPTFFVSHLSSGHLSFETRALHGATYLHFTCPHMRGLKVSPGHWEPQVLLLMLLRWCQSWKLKLDSRDAGCACSQLLWCRACPKAELASVPTVEDSAERAWRGSGFPAVSPPCTALM